MKHKHASSRAAPWYGQVVLRRTHLLIVAFRPPDGSRFSCAARRRRGQLNPDGLHQIITPRLLEQPAAAAAPGRFDSRSALLDDGHL